MSENAELIEKVDDLILGPKVSGLSAAVDLAIFGGVPVTTVALAMFQSYYKSSAIHRSHRVAELLEDLEDNAEKIAKIVTDTETYQDQFVRLLREYVITSDPDKRKILSKTFIESLEDESDYSIEKFISVTQQLTKRDLHLFTLVDTSMTTDLNYRIFNGEADEDQISSILNLQAVGLLRTPNSARMVTDGSGEPYVVITPFGQVYMKHVADVIQQTTINPETV